MTNVRLVFLVLCVLLLSACKKSRPTSDVVPLPVVTDATTDMLFTWIDEKGEFHVEQKVADVPAVAREVVRVADPVKDPPKLDDVFVVDLRQTGPNGAYAVRAIARTDFEKMAVERRQKSGTVLEPKAAETAAPEAARPAVIIYGASWCGACHQAAAYLKQRGIPFIEKDIEEDQGAAREMQAKLASVGKRGGSIPVLDVRGKILIGFDEGSVNRALGVTL